MPKLVFYFFYIFLFYKLSFVQTRKQHVVRTNDVHLISFPLPAILLANTLGTLTC